MTKIRHDLCLSHQSLDPSMNRTTDSNIFRTVLTHWAQLRQLITDIHLFHSQLKRITGSDISNITIKFQEGNQRILKIALKWKQSSLLFFTIKENM